jgi:hypothetical protein
VRQINLNLIDADALDTGKAGDRPSKLGSIFETLNPSP